MKNYTDLEQSKKLAKILPLESADMFYNLGESQLPNVIYGNHNDFKCYLPCWSLTALLGVMICPKLEEYIEGVWDLIAFTDNTLKTPIEIQDCKDPIDACVEMIIKLHEMNLL